MHYNLHLCIKLYGKTRQNRFSQTQSEHRCRDVCSTHSYLIELQGNIKDKHGETSPVRDTRNNYHPILKSLKREMHAPKQTKCRWKVTLLCRSMTSVCLSYYSPLSRAIFDRKKDKIEKCTWINRQNDTILVSICHLASHYCCCYYVCN